MAVTTTRARPDEQSIIRLGLIMGEFDIESNRHGRSDELRGKSLATVSNPVGGADSFGLGAAMISAGKWCPIEGDMRGSLNSPNRVGPVILNHGTNSREEP